MTEITTDHQLEQLCEEIFHATERFYNRTLKDLVAYKILVGRTLTTSPLKDSYGEGLIDRVAQETGLKRSTLYEACQMYEKEKLTPKKEPLFLKSFTENYSSWNDYKTKQLGVAKVEKPDACKHCKFHCPHD